MVKTLLQLHTTALICGILLDQIIGDPYFMPHPIRDIGRFIMVLEKKLLGETKGVENRDPKGEKRRGILTWFIVILTTLLFSTLIVVGAYMINKYLGIVVESILTCYILAARSLCKESMAVSKELQKGDIPGARYKLSMIVGRDTAELSEEEIIKAAVETVSENTSDGVIAPLIYTAIGGPILGFLYKAVNTMDSMLGYKNDRFKDFGFFAAKADDVFNYLPSRISALFMIAGAFVLRLFSESYDPKGAAKIWKRDRLNHKSPNSAQTESVCAGALGLKLGGPHLYGGVMVDKPFIGDEKRHAEVRDVARSNALMFMTEAVSVAIIVLLLITIMFLLK
ncbi:MAG: cobalamin biosynthesis protein CobD [Lachnospiraceae bacterium]|nr:cobalamin biosynthesis protein CobD [Lachnospiraceae bacterium]